MQLAELTNSILSKVPQSLIPNDQDAALIQANKAFFVKYENELVTGFYNAIFGDENLKTFVPNEQRKEREQTLHQWYRVTTSGRFDTAYWQWQAFIGVVHVKHKIPNAAMIGMWGWILNFVQEKAFTDLAMTDVQALMAVMHKLQVVVSSLVVESFIITEREAIKSASGLNNAILDRFIYIEIDRLLKEGREILQQSLIQQAA
jgi:hypothetical protein